MKGSKKKEAANVRHQVRETAKPSNVVMVGDKVHCDNYCKKSNDICGANVFESVPIA
jgi:predicted HAD superfamily phosphohydrolase YqeG